MPHVLKLVFHDSFCSDGLGQSHYSIRFLNFLAIAQLFLELLFFGFDAFILHFSDKIVGRSLISLSLLSPFQFQ